LTREFHLSPPGKGLGVSRDADGAYIGAIPILHRLEKTGSDEWRLRDCGEISEQLSLHYGLPIDMTSKIGGLRTIANALNKGDLARAQIATVLLGISDPPQLAKGDGSREQMIELIRDLRWTGMLKWDPDEHPRWPAGSEDGIGGRFAPRDEDGETGDLSSSQSDPTHSYSSRAYALDQITSIQLADAGMGDAFDDPVAEAVRAAARRVRARIGATDSAITEFDRNDGSSTTQINFGATPIRALDASGQPILVDEKNPNTEDDGIYSAYGNHIGGVQLAGATIPMGSLGITGTNPANWVNLARLTDGSLEFGSGQIITAAALLSALDQSRERDAVRSAIAKFGLNPKQAADILAARAYVWANTAAPWNFKGVPVSGPGLESVSKSIMLVELARPGTLYFASQGDRLSTTFLNMAAQEGLSDASILESRVRLANAPAALQSTSASARAALNLKPNDNMQAHHLVPVNIVADNLELATLASKAGWYTDADNLIALPADPQTQAALTETGRRLPMQRSAHPIYDAQTQKQIDALKLLAGSPLTPMKARSILEKVAIENLRQILSGEWDPMLKSS
jgi:hypothetical protein